MAEDERDAQALASSQSHDKTRRKVRTLSIFRDTIFSEAASTRAVTRMTT